MRCFYTCFLLSQPSAGQHCTAYKFDMAVAKDMLASTYGVCKGNTPLPFWVIYFKYFIHQYVKMCACSSLNGIDQGFLLSQVEGS